MFKKCLVFRQKTPYSTQRKSFKTYWEDRDLEEVIVQLENFPQSIKNPKSMENEIFGRYISLKSRTPYSMLRREFRTRWKDWNLPGLDTRRPLSNKALQAPSSGGLVSESIFEEVSDSIFGEEMRKTESKDFWHTNFQRSKGNHTREMARASLTSFLFQYFNNFRFFDFLRVHFSGRRWGWERRQSFVFGRVILRETRTSDPRNIPRFQNLVNI